MDYRNKDIYICDIINSLVSDYKYPEQQAQDIFKYYKPAFDLIDDRYETPEYWAEILHNHYADFVTVQDWISHVKRIDQFPVYGESPIESAMEQIRNENKQLKELLKKLYSTAHKLDYAFCTNMYRGESGLTGDEYEKLTDVIIEVGDYLGESE